MIKVIENTNSIKQPEEWRPISGYEGLYEVSNWGRVRSFKWNSNGRILSPCNRRGYYYVELCKDRKEKRYHVHRLVATAFIPNPNNLPEVNHKDEDKGNNHVTNLEWCDRSYNIVYGTRTQRMVEKLSIPVVALDKNGNLVSEFESIREASRVTGIHQGSICGCCNHKYGYKSVKSFIFRYKDEYTANHTKHD